MNNKYKYFAQSIMNNQLGLKPALKDIVLLESQESMQKITYLLFRISGNTRVNYKIYVLDHHYIMEIIDTLTTNYIVIS